MSLIGKAGRPRNKPPDLKGATQFDRFVETAKALDADDGGAAFLRAMDVLSPPVRPSPKKKKGVAAKQPPSLTDAPKDVKMVKTTKD